MHYPAEKKQLTSDLHHQHMLCFGAGLCCLFQQGIIREPALCTYSHFGVFEHDPTRRSVSSYKYRTHGPHKQCTIMASYNHNGIIGS